MVFWAYMLHCRGGVFYTGHTDDLERRVAQHQSGLVPGFTQGLRPLELVWSQAFQTRYEALTAERKIKGWARPKKLALIRGDWNEISRLAKGKSGPSTSSGRTGIEVGQLALEVGQLALDVMLNEAARAHPEEACGLLLGSAERIEGAVSTRNVHPTPRTHFEIDPAALIAAHKVAREGGAGIAGYWHSHPTGPAAPSATDRASASGDGRIWAIVADGVVAFWRDASGGFEALPTRVVDG